MSKAYLKIVWIFLPLVGIGKSHDKYIRETMFYEKLANGKVQCHTCFRECIIPEGSRNRENHNGLLKR